MSNRPAAQYAMKSRLLTLALRSGERDTSPHRIITASTTGMDFLTSIPLFEPRDAIVNPLRSDRSDVWRRRRTGECPTRGCEQQKQRTEVLSKAVAGDRLWQTFVRPAC